VTSSPARRPPGPARSLTREQIVEAGLELMRTEGLDAVSLRGVARTLGVNPMALYTYLRDKDELLAGMFDAMMSALAVPAVDDLRPAEDQIVAYFVDVRRVLATNADLYRLVRPLAGAAATSFAQADRICELFLSVDIAPAHALWAWETVTQLTIGSALVWSGAEGRSLGDVVATAAEQLSEEDAAAFPSLTMTLASAQADDPERVFIDAVRALLRAAPRAGR
jgi:TetR/AcrR family tetracycline transcriptional repressor